MQKLYPQALWHFNRREKKIYLTFDDGPVPSVTEWVLDELEKRNIKATFFCVGDNIQKNPQIFERIINSGHSVGNHTMTHVNGLKCRLETYLKEITDCEALTKTKLFRPPYGRMKRKQYQALAHAGFHIVMWDVISYDYESISPEKVWNHLLPKTQNGSIVLFHDSIKAEKNIRNILPRFLQHYQEQGFSFGKIIDGMLINRGT